MIEVTVIASGSSGNCYLVDDGASRVLLDAGIPISEIRAGCGFMLSKVSGALITHKHSDHSKAVKDLLRSGIDVWIPRLELAELKIKPNHRLHFPEPCGDSGQYEVFRCGTFTVLPFRTEHDTPEPVGYLLLSLTTHERLLYFTDTYYVRWKFGAIDYLIGECNYSSSALWERVEDGSTQAARAKRLFESHMSLDNFLTFLKSSDLSKLKKIYICHMSDDHGDEQKISDDVKALTGTEVIVC